MKFTDRDTGIVICTDWVNMHAPEIMEEFSRFRTEREIPPEEPLKQSLMTEFELTVLRKILNGEIERTEPPYALHLNSPLVRDIYERYCHSIGWSIYLPMSDDKRHTFEIWASDYILKGSVKL